MAKVIIRTEHRKAFKEGDYKNIPALELKKLKAEVEDKGSKPIFGAKKAKKEDSK